ncbi:MAG: hypothetical protein AB7I18_10600 [Candidatus Berkiella sp.]
MLKSPQKTEKDDFSELLEDSQQLFRELNPFLVNEIALLMGPAQASTQYVTA